MMEATNVTRLEGRRLVLGFDGGCFACSGLAGRIERRLDGKIEVRNLREPQVREWRRNALGEDAPWAPALFEINGSKVRAWTGWKLGANLSRFLGPVATWRVMQELGEVTAVPGIEDSPVAEAIGISRGQFLKGMGGAAVAVSVLTGGTLLPSVASAQESSNGTAEEQKKAKSIVRRTKEFQSLADMQEQEGATFDFPNAEVQFSSIGRRAIVVVHSRSDRTAVLATFKVNIVNERLIYYVTEVYGVINDTDLKVTLWVNGREPSQDHQTRIGENYIVTQDNRIMSHEEYKQEIEEARQNQRAAAYTTASTSDYQDCVNAEKVSCYEAISIPCTAVEALGLGLAPFTAGASATVALGGFVACGILSFSTCPDLARTRCEEQAASPQPVAKPPSYYC